MNFCIFVPNKWLLDEEEWVVKSWRKWKILEEIFQGLKPIDYAWEGMSDMRFWIWDITWNGNFKHYYLNVKVFTILWFVVFKCAYSLANCPKKKRVNNDIKEKKIFLFLCAFLYYLKSLMSFMIVLLSYGLWGSSR